MRIQLRAAAAILAASALLPFTAQAEEAVSTRTKVVSYADLDPAREADARQLLRRLNNASAQVCRRGERIETRAARRCRDAAVAEAVRTIKAPVLTILHDGGAPVALSASR